MKPLLACLTLFLPHGIAGWINRRTKGGAAK
jgi:hypothetical protein